MENALKISNFIKTKDEFPALTDTQIGGNNFKISGGQQKRYKLQDVSTKITNEKKLLILNKPTENFDKESKVVFLMNLKKYKNDKTIILISHNTDDLKICDKIYDLEKILNLN